MNEKLKNALLSLDAYNRSYNEGIELNVNSIGNYSIHSDSEDLGTALDSSGNPILDSNGDPVRKDVHAGFYGIAYQHVETDPQSPDYQDTIISYRGTDQFGSEDGIGGDGANGWLVGGEYIGVDKCVIEQRT